jgi:hypothetical protein
MLLAGKGARGKAAGLAPPQHTEARSASSAPYNSDNFRVAAGEGNDFGSRMAAFTLWNFACELHILLR